MDIADVLIHVPRNFSGEQRTEIETDLSGCDGVLSVHFSRTIPHAVLVAYRPEAIRLGAILERVREQDPAATMVGW